MYRLAASSSKLAHLAAALYAPTVSWVFASPHDPYLAWDCLAVVALLRPSVLRFEDATTRVVTTGRSAGALRVVPDGGGGGNASTAGLSAAKRVRAAVWADAAAFEAFMLETFSAAALC